MTALQIARDWHRRFIPTEDFASVVTDYLKEGVVYSSPQVFVCGRECFWDGEDYHMDKTPNAWFVYMAAAVDQTSPVREFMRVANRPHKWALWCRRNDGRVRAYDWETLAGKVGL
jgi:hypothetical protein